MEVIHLLSLTGFSRFGVTILVPSLLSTFNGGQLSQSLVATHTYSIGSYQPSSPTLDHARFLCSSDGDAQKPGTVPTTVSQPRPHEVISHCNKQQHLKSHHRSCTRVDQNDSLRLDQSPKGMKVAALPINTDYIEKTLIPPGKLTSKMRPPDMEIRATMDDRQAMRQRKAGRRESRLGFGRLFGRNRFLNDDEPTAVSRHITGSKDAQDVSETIAGPPYSLQSQGLHSAPHLVLTKDDIPATRPKTAGLRSPTFAPPKSPMPPSARRRGSLATTTTAWDPVPLFQAWPQAVRTITLPACAQTDHLLRMHNKKETLAQINHPDLGDERAMFVEMARKRHRRNSSSYKMEWTTKTFMLVTAGYLLQYPGEGPHDRLPEKVVQLTKDSAAFASDVIPGRHWVLQVSSVFEDGALVSNDTRTLLGKFGLREKERRQAPDILMVFESASEMDSWMTLLRKEIEMLGGKTPVTETGTPKQADELSPSEASPLSPLQRTVPVRDHTRFGRTSISTPDMRGEAVTSYDKLELQFDGPLIEVFPEHTFDDNSATNSFISQDGQQLEGLRDSATRYSFVSAARTIVTSDSSACNSPIRDSFGSGSHQSESSTTPMPDESSEPRLRPNASDIEDRRQSYRTSNMFLDNNSGFLSHRQHASLSAVQEPPNFSFPQPAARRRAATQTAPDTVHIAHAARPPRRPRRPPPPTLGFTRPLSIVADTPSPRSEPRSSPFKTDDCQSIPEPPSTPSLFATWAAETGRPEYDVSSRASSRGSMRTSFQVSVRSSPRKYASMNSLRPADHSLWDDASNIEPTTSSTSRTVSPTRAPRSPPTANIPRSMTSMEPVPAGMLSPSAPRSRSPIRRAMAAQKRASLMSLPAQSPGSPRRGSVVSVIANNTAHRLTQSDHHEDHFIMRSISPAPPRRESMMSMVPSVHGHGRTESNASAKSFLSNRRSLPQMPLTQLTGPPPAPPPNKALPPLPVGKTKPRAGSIPPRMRAHVSVLPGGEF